MTINNLKKANQTKFYEIVESGNGKNYICYNDKKVNERFILFLSKLTDRKINWS